MKLYNYKSSYQNFSAVKWRVKEYDAGENSNYSKDNIYDTMNAVYSRINNRGLQEESMRVILSLTIGHYMHEMLYSLPEKAIQEFYQRGEYRLD